MLLGKKYIADVDLIVRWNESVIPKTYAIERTNQMTIKYSPVKNSIRSPYPDASKKDCLEELEPISPKAEYSIMSPLKVSISSQVKRFFGRHHKSRSLDCTGSSEQTAACKERYETDHEFADDEDSNFSDSWNVSFANFYPQKIEYLSRLMEIPCKKQAATNILRYYRRHVWCAKKQKLNLKREIHKAKNVRRLTSLKADDGKSLCTINLKTKKLVETHVLHNSGIAESGENGIHSRYTNVTPKFKNAKTENLQVSVLSQTFTLSPEKTFICNPSTVSTRPKGSIKCDFLSSNPSNPHTSLVALTENSQTGRSPSNLPSLPWLNQRQQKNERILKVQKWLNSMEKAEEPKEMQRTLKRRHSFSSFPVVKSPAKNCLTYESSFEAVYRKLVLQDPQQRTLHKGRNINLITQTHVSQTLSALINSPMSYRAKRVAGDDFMCLSKLKRHRTMIEPLIPDVSSLESKYMKNYNSYSTTASLPQLNADWSVGLCNKNYQRPYLEVHIKCV
ncbi:uncharacterized protein LOC128652491 [Bombina bombina]|uniref:uncharacterized protein LOC128652491 n=1 Tax=Bombina bombina TaxID=8345 RepID=UPI00235A5810|nr:uncharacterized protein LOC128652491 [Bombina bombina]